ncbi:hypothetical protein MVEN_02395000 [Mycena venus]|uniref:Uncharacterized protein n=1 Tax=Mycena venus TaxID=2733690 RepID=A0A8H6X2K2_9AGAR|nr:hypothetical protein MVEN_02395000 [Mycena venus]
MEHSVDASSFTVYWLNMLFALYATSTTLLLYGLYVMLFTLSVRILRRRNPGEKQALLVATYTMLLLGTLQTILWLFTTGISVRMTQVLVEQDAMDSLSRLWRLYFTLDVAQNIVFVTNSCVTDMLFLYRCYIIWGSRWKIIATPALCILSTVVLGVIATVSYDSVTQVHYIDRRVPFIMNVATNVLLVCLTAGRIWWMKHEARVLLGTESPARYATAIAMILESGSIYCLCLIFQVVAQSLVPSNASNIFLGVATGLGQQVVNIAPTLIVVRVGLGDPVPNTGVISSKLVFKSTPLDILTSTRSPDSSQGIGVRATNSQVFEGSSRCA